MDRNSFDSLNTFSFEAFVANVQKNRVYFSVKRLKLLSFCVRSTKHACARMETESPIEIRIFV